MADRYDIISGIKARNGDKTYWTKVGVAFPTKSGNGFTLYLDFIPAGRNDDGKLQLLMAEPKPRDDERPAARPSRGREPPAAEPMDDDIPF